MEKPQQHFPRVLPARLSDEFERESQLMKVLQLVPQLRSNNTSHHDHGDDVQRIRRNSEPFEIPMEDQRACNGCQPQQQPKRAQVQWANIDVRVHKPRCSKYTFAAAEPRSRPRPKL